MQYTKLEINTNSIELIDLIIKNSNQRIKDDLLIQASENGRIDMIELLLENGANVHTLDDICLINASFDDRADIVQLLLEHGANVHTNDNICLRVASRRGYFKIVQLLLEHGADVHAYMNSDTS